MRSGAAVKKVRRVALYLRLSVADLAAAAHRRLTGAPDLLWP
jgi:hypothetical protein